MARTRDVLEEWADWYGLPEAPTMPRAGAPALRSAFATAAGGLASAVAALLVWHDRARQRRALMEMGDDMLGDIGISCIDALNEARKPFWRN